MTTTVVLIRHAAPLIGGHDSDFTRPLSDHGKKIQHQMDSYLRERTLIPDAIWYSPFKRTEETARIIAQDFNVVPTEELSLGEYFDEDDLLSKLPPPNENLCIFMVGHGPSLMRLATYWTGMRCYSGAPTHSSSLHIDFDSQIASGKGECMRYYCPELDLPGFIEH